MNPEEQPVTTLRQVLEQSAGIYAERLALADVGGESISYGELLESVRALSHLLEEEGVSFGDRVIILAEICMHWGVAYFAITSMGAVAVPLLTEFHSDAIAHVIRHCEAKAVFVSEKLFSKLEGMTFDQAPLMFNLDTFARFDFNGGRSTLQELKAAGLREFRKLKERLQGIARAVPTEPEPDDVAAIIYTSGTTGHSKGVVLTHKNIVSNATSTYSLFKLFASDVMLSILPLPHTFECTVGLVYPISCGTSVHYLGKPPTARVLLPALSKVQPTAMLTVPLIIEKIYKTTILPKILESRLKRRLFKFSLTHKFVCRKAGKKLIKAFGGKLRILAIGGAPLATDAEAFLLDSNFPYAVGYGLTETAPILSGAAPGLTKISSAGPPIPGVRLRLGNVNEQSGEGEIEAFGPNVMREYYKNPEMTAEVFTGDGWLRTGDLGAIDGDGYIFIKGRSKNMILGPSGENIYPEEIESFFFASPYVQEVLVYKSGNVLAARVYLDAEAVEAHSAANPESGTEALLDDIRKEVNSKVSTFARIHKIIEQFEPFEKTATQKIKRYLYVDPE